MAKPIDLQNPINYAERYKFKSAVYIRVHREKSKNKQMLSQNFGILILVLSTLSSSTLYAFYFKNPSAVIQPVVLGLSLFTAILTAIQSFFRWSEKSIKHKKAAGEFMNVHFTMVNLILKFESYSLPLTELVREKVIDEITKVMLKYSQATADAPTVSDRDYQHYKKQEIASSTEKINPSTDKPVEK